MCAFVCAARGERVAAPVSLPPAGCELRMPSSLFTRSRCEMSPAIHGEGALRWYVFEETNATLCVGGWIPSLKCNARILEYKLFWSTKAINLPLFDTLTKSPKFSRLFKGLLNLLWPLLLGCRRSPPSKCFWTCRDCWSCCRTRWTISYVN